MTKKLSDHPGHAHLDDRPSLKFDRREFLGFVGASLAASATAAACGGLEQEKAPPAPLLEANPFTLGVASGDPTPDGAVLWTRLAPEPLATVDATSGDATRGDATRGDAATQTPTSGGMPDEPVPVIWEISRQKNFYSIETYGWMFAEAQFAHSVHVEVSGLEANQTYYYRFRIGREWVSPTGRMRTFPRPGDSPRRLRLATASCQSWRHGYYNAYRHLAQEDIDLLAFLGDYIYESGIQGPVRDHEGPRPTTLEGFRNRYALYKGDADLQAAHQRCAWIFTWDDHEVKNNYANLDIDADISVEQAKALRAAAYQAYYEHMPLRIPLPDEPADMQIYRRLQYGDLVNFHVLDGRQYRTDQPCNDDAGRTCDEVYDEDRTMLGAEQRAWLEAGLRSSKTVWNALVQQTVFASLNLGGGVVNPDQWDGYTVERQRLLSLFAEESVRNVVVHTGDIHTAIFATLHREANDFASEVVGVECVTTSISSPGLAGSRYPVDVIERVMRRQKNIDFFEPARRGYCVCEYTPEKMTVEFKGVSAVDVRDSEVAVDATFEVSAKGEEG